MLGPFETQRKTTWFRNMLLSQRYPGHKWHHRAMHAMHDAVRTGEELTAFEIVKRVEPLIGTCENRNHRLEFTRTACKLGLLEMTEKTRQNPEGRTYPSPVYRVLRRPNRLPDYMQ